MKEIPAIDLSEYKNASTPEAKAAFYEKLLHAAHEVGFFYLVGHGISEELCDKLRAQSKEFFRLPLEVKQKIALENSKHFRGYTAVGGEYTLGQKDWREEIDLGLDQPPRGDEPAFMRLYGPNQWSDETAELKKTFDEWQGKVNEMGFTLLDAFSNALYGRSGVFDELFGDDFYEHGKLIHYPGRAEAGDEYSADTQGVGAHKDDGFLTLLMIDEIAGLQVEAKKGEWIDVGYKKGAFVINIGEFLEIATDGYLRATNHRVKSPLKGQERISCVIFLGSKLDHKLKVYELPPQLKEKMRGVERDPHNPLIPTIGWNYLKHRLRSHKEVAQKFYADVYDPTNPASALKAGIGE